MEDYNILLTDVRLSSAVSFWRDRLTSVGETFRLGPAGSPAPGGESAEPLEVRLGRRAAAVIAEIGAGEMGEFTVATAAVALLLARYSRRATVVLRTPPIADAGGDTTACVPLIIDVDDGLSVAEYLSEVARVVEESYSETRLPLRELADREGRVPFDSLTTVALFDARLHVPHGDADDPAELRFQLDLNEGRVRLHWRPSAERFLAEGLAAGLPGVIEQLGQLDAGVGEIGVVTAAERRRLLDEFNEEASATPFLNAVEMFERQVRRTPEAPALIFQDRVTTYAELNARANCLAHRLRARHGAGAETPVGIRLDRSDLTVVAVLGVLKAGASFVPLDPDYPLERVNYILREAGLGLLITQSDYFFDELDFDGPVLALDLEPPALPEETADPHHLIDPASLAYVIYTSGSTGRPKGCELEHRNLANYLAWAVGYYFEDDACGNFGLYSSLSFDFTLTNICCPLLRGKSLRVYPQSDNIQTILTHALGVASGIDVMKLTPSHVRMLAHLPVRDCGVRKVVVGGEELTAGEIEILRSLNPAVEIYNEYGPTEATVGCVVKKIGDEAGPVLIGRPVANTSVFVLDEGLKLVPVGVRGEVCVSGASVARGYRNRPGMTAEKFVPHPFAAGERLYRTGDIGRWLPDGQLQCFGRNDDQVKVRGHRVELGEIESVLAAHPHVRGAVVLPREDQQGNKRLTAYLVADARLTADAARQYVAGRLPDYMTPSEFLFPGEFPLSANGKVDRRALAALQHAGTRDLTPSRPPADERERRLLLIWQELFETASVGVTDSFFALGGDSLLAVQVVSRVWNNLGVEITIEDIFEQQTIAGLAAHIAPAAAPAESRQERPLVPSPRDGDLPLSFSQQRLWFLAQLEGPSAAYNLSSAVRLDGELDGAALESAISAVVARHESLRTTFPADSGGTPSQRISEPRPFRLPVREVPPDAGHLAEAEVLRLAAEEAARPFDLTEGPLLRVSLFRLKPDAHILVLAVHHIISDGWSMGVLVRELSALYAAFRLGAAPTLPELSVQYADYARWQRQRMRAADGRPQLDYWKEQLADAPAVLELPTDRPRPSTQSFNGAAEPFSFGPELRARLQALSQESGTSLFMVVLAAFSALLSRYTNQRDLVVGTPVTNRPAVELEPLIGFFVNTLALRVDLARDPSFRELLERVRRVALDGYAHQEVPFEQLVDALELGRDLSHSPVFQVMLAYENTPAPALDLPGLAASPLRVEAAGAKFDLTLYVDASDAGLSGSFEYNTDLFDLETVARMAGNFEALLAAVAADPELRLSAIPLLSPAERRLRREWNATEAEYPVRCVHGLFEEQAERTPGAVALIFGRERLTYGELNARANRLAHRLRRRHGAGPEVLVGVCMERSVEMVVSLLAILKAGAAYVPVDPDYPEERVRFMLEDSRVPVLLTQQHLAGRLPSTGPSVLCVDAEREELEAESSDDPEVEAGPVNLAYMIYTSGSTGRPKGALNEHRGVVNRLLWMQDAYRLDASDRVLQKTPFSFDVSVWEFFWPLLTGARMVIARPGGHRESDYLVDLIVEEGITTLHFVPSMLRAFLEEPGVSRCTSLRRVICSGEALPVEFQEKFFGQLDAELHNLYGPTEAAVDVTSWRCAPDPDLHRVPIGWPIANTQIHIVDATLRPVPSGVPGELLIGGVGVGRGYHGDPALTAGKFIPDPFRDEPGARLYRTGDLARYRPDGSIDFLGRIDHQVKIRGFRIEPGEVEEVLRGLGGVRDCVVTSRQDRGITRLVAYVVSNPEGQTAAVLREALRRSLPDYMVPSAFVELPELPLLPNGKVDRKALPAPPTPAELPPGSDSALTPREALLAGIWCDVLHLDSVGVHDNFFELGGDSILSIQVVARASRAGLRITPKQFFQNQTIAELARVAVEKSERRPSVVAAGPAPLTPIQHWFFEQDLEEVFHFNQSVLIRVPPDVNPELMAGAVRHLYRHHDGLRLRFARAGDGWTQQVSEADDDAVFACEDLSGHPKEERARVMAGIAGRVERSLDIENGPLMRVRLFRFGDGEPGRLWMVIHHLAVDGVSWRILLEDLYQVYGHLARGEEVRLPPGTTSFKEWSHLLAEHARSAEGRAEAQFWLEAARPEPTPIPLDRPADRPANRVGDTDAVVVSLSEAETLSLLQEVPKAYNTRINDVLLTALALALGRDEGSSTLLVDFEAHGRREFSDEIDLSRTVGWFTTISPVLVRVEPGAPLGETLKSVKEQIRRIPEDGFGYALHKYLSPDEELRAGLRALPRPEILFNYLGQTDLVLPPSTGWSPAPEEVGTERAPSAVRSHLLEIVAMVTGGSLQVNWIYSRKIHDRETIERAAGRFVEMLRALIRHCCAPASRGFTPADFPAARLNQKDLDKLARLITARNPDTAKDSVEDIYELSPMQRGLIFHSLFDLESPSYFEQLSCVIEGDLNAELLVGVWKRVLERHATLRTGFFWHDLAHPVQVVFRSLGLPWELYDWRSRPAAERQQAFDAFLARDRARGFDLGQAPLFRCTLIREGETTHRFCWSHHHILLDGWSAAILMKDVFATYDSAVKGGELTQPQPRPRLYRTYIEWLQAQDGAHAEAYWRKALKGFYGPTPLPEDPLRRAPAAGRTLEEADALLTEELTQQVGARARALRITLNSLIRGAWAFILSRYSGERDVVFGVTVAGRPPLLEGIESMVGLFINTLPVRFSIKPEESLASWLSDIHQSQTELDQYAFSSLVDIQKWSDIPAGTPLFNSLLVFENYPVDKSFDRQPGGLRLRDVRVFDQTNYPLTLTAVPGQRMLLRIAYDEAVGEAAALRLLEHLRTLLASFCADPSLPLRRLALLSPDEGRALLASTLP
ncbi:MAG: amino acid adenylation domain-containing protein, partial [Pyrinomonadaceae bacterium]